MKAKKPPILFNGDEKKEQRKLGFLEERIGGGHYHISFILTNVYFIICLNNFLLSSSNFF